MIIHDVTQGSPEWDALRAAHDTASEASAMMGASKKTSRSELLRMKATGTVKEFSDWVQKNLLDNGHIVEANARPIIEYDIGEELYPCTATSEEHARLLASFDGVTMLEDVIWECKSWNEEKAADVRDGRIPEEDFWQVVQQMVVSRASECVYTVTDGTPERTISTRYTLKPEDEKSLIAGWKQFNEDRANYVHTEAKPEVVAAPVSALPAITYQLNGLALTSNLDLFRKHAEAAIEKSKAPLVTDQDFADREALCKAFAEAEKKLQLVREQVVGEIHDVDAFCRGLAEIGEHMRQARLAGEKQVKSRKDEIKLEIREKALNAFKDHCSQLNLRLGSVTLPAIHDGFSAAMKNKRTIATLQDAVDTELARLKIEANEWAEKILTNLDILREIATGYEGLFRDRQELVLKDSETVRLIAKQRVDEHKAEEQRKLEAERERIRQEEAARLEAEQKERERKAEEKRVADEMAQRESEAGGQAGGAHTRTELEAGATADLLDAKPAIASTPSEAESESRASTRVEVVNKLELLKGVINGEVPYHVITVDMAALTQLCNDLQRPVPGTTWGKA